jgi:hypothetical protein
LPLFRAQTPEEEKSASYFGSQNSSRDLLGILGNYVMENAEGNGLFEVALKNEEKWENELEEEKLKMMKEFSENNFEEDEKNFFLLQSTISYER